MIAISQLIPLVGLFTNLAGYHARAGASFHLFHVGHQLGSSKIIGLLLSPTFVVYILAGWVEIGIGESSRISSSWPISEPLQHKLPAIFDLSVNISSLDKRKVHQLIWGYSHCWLLFTVSSWAILWFCAWFILIVSMSLHIFGHSCSCAKMICGCCSGSHQPNKVKYPLFWEKPHLRSSTQGLGSGWIWGQALAWKALKAIEICTK